ncbi:AraC family transcriptional regulator [Candidatus Nitronereus thalassa]|uniref:AraC family transcriptional regulator n=1 Tax=Candidatus Nitronereus thalassa TaxID=3020898 RepID=A0ABU3K2X6_9BACT|nr:AraC family transcriptional regulator [Candidatus Nitronereus thalassa]MDT7040747.1 AraC family transcriptional regulator [Candidatus Nitronereus thalassa]
MEQFFKPSTFRDGPSKLNSEGSDLELRGMLRGKLYPQESFGPHGIMNDLIVEFQQYLTDWTTRVKQVGMEQKLKHLAPHVFNECLRQMEGPPRPTPDLAQQIEVFISTNLHKGLTLKELSKFLGYSEKYCSELFQVKMGEAFSSYLKRHRLEKAKVLLEEGFAPIADIAERLGFQDQFAFSHFFKKATGHSPRKYREQVHQRKHGFPRTEPVAFSSSALRNPSDKRALPYG